MSYTDGIIIRCPDCGTLNVLLAGYKLGRVYKCLYCEGQITPKDNLIFKTGPGLIS